MAGQAARIADRCAFGTPGPPADPRERMIVISAVVIA